jgi:hypothetical protein
LEVPEEEGEAAKASELPQADCDAFLGCGRVTTALEGSTLSEKNITAASGKEYPILIPIYVFVELIIPFIISYLPLCRINHTLHYFLFTSS